MTTATSEPTSRDRRLHRDGLAASQRMAACGQEGLETAFRLAIEEGFVDGYDDLDDYLEAVLEGEVEDELREAGWRPCLRPRRCWRAGRCARRAG